MKIESEYKGKWWLPNKARRKIDGTLIINPNCSGTLEIRGLLIQSPKGIGYFPEVEKNQIILGLTSSGSKITLLNCRVTNTSYSSDGFHTQTYHIDTTFIDLHVKTKEKIKFKEINIQFQYLDYLLKNSSIKKSLNKETESLTIEIVKTVPIQLCTIDHFDIKVHTTSNVNFSSAASEKINVEGISLISIESEKERNYDEFLTLIYKIQTFLTFCLSVPVFPTKISGISSLSTWKPTETSQPIPNQISIVTHWNDLFDASNPIDIRRREIVFTINDTQENITEIMRNWFIKSEEFNSIFELFFTTFFNPKMYLHHTFLTLAQCIESYHRKSQRYKNHVTNPEDYQKRIEIVHTALKENSILNSHQRRSIINWLKEGNKPSLENRINQILKNYPTVFNFITGNDSRFAKTIADNRNHLTHLDPKPEVTYATYEQLYYLSLRMRLLLTLIILDEIGFKQKDIEEKIPRLARGFGLID